MKASKYNFVLFILLSHCGISESTSLWMTAHSLEKHFKSWLLKCDPTVDLKLFSHKLNKLWDESKARFPQDGIFKVAEYRTFINELNMENRATELRYSYGIEIKDPIFTRVYTSLSCALRIAILGEKQFRERGAFGLCNASFGGYSYFFEKSKFDAKSIVCSEVNRLLSL